MTMMPIGVPKVAYKMPGSRGGEWVDIYQRLTRERIIFMGSEIDDEMANQIIGVLLVSSAPYLSSPSLLQSIIYQPSVYYHM
jgi:ATP-dependent protease ClpP protease subunit